jgi:hypothetical protein
VQGLAFELAEAERVEQDHRGHQLRQAQFALPAPLFRAVSRQARRSKPGSNRRQKSSIWQKSSVKLSMDASCSSVDLFLETKSYAKSQASASSLLIPNSGYQEIGFKGFAKPQRLAE